MAANNGGDSRVVPHEGTWIEIKEKTGDKSYSESFPTRERGLKLKSERVHGSTHNVVPHEGTWIEM